MARKHGRQLGLRLNGQSFRDSGWWGERHHLQPRALAYTQSRSPASGGVSGPEALLPGGQGRRQKALIRQATLLCHCPVGTGSLAHISPVNERPNQQPVDDRSAARRSDGKIYRL
jgi:hypothetical protein